MLTALSPQVLEQRRLLLPADSDAHVDGVRGQRGPQAALRAGDPAGGGEQPGRREGALGGWGLTAASSQTGRRVRSVGSRRPRRLALHRSPGPWQSCTGDTSSPSRTGKEAEDGPTESPSLSSVYTTQTNTRTEFLSLFTAGILYVQLCCFCPSVVKTRNYQNCF